MLNRTLLVTCLSALPASWSCGSATPPAAPASASAGANAAANADTPGETAPATGRSVALEDVGLSTAAMDPSADPCVDFYRYACGGWIDQTELPADQPRWSRSFSEIQKRNELLLKDVFERAAADPGDDPITAAIGAYYGACMDEAAIEQHGIAGIEPLLAKARAIKKWKQIGAVITELHRYGIYPAFSPDIDQDFKHPDKITPFLYQGGLGLPDRDYYLADQFAKQREFYAGHVARMMALAGMSEADAKRAAASVMKIETELAKVSKTRVEMRDLPKLYNKIDRSGLAKVVKNIDWDAYFAAQGVPELTDLAVTSIEFFEGLNGLIKRATPRQWSDYLQWVIVRTAAPTLPKAFVDEQFAMRQALTGQKEQQPRWKRCVRATDAALREYTGRKYVEQRFSPQSKQAVTMMIRAISDAFAAELPGYDWMDEQTRAGAAAKRDKMAFLIGYPDEWKTYPFSLDPKTYTENWLAASRYDNQMQWEKTKKPVDRREWNWSAAMVNASYHPLRNTMTFPAGILQPPFFNPDATIAVNLGALGMVVGHELTHGFDDNGALFDADGAMRNWWSDAVAKNFDDKKQCLVDQYNAFEVLPGVHVNGQLTLGENIADLGGVKLAYRAYKALRKDAEPVVAGGFTEDQQFFLAVGQTWCSKSTDEIARMLVQIDPHSPPEFRVRGALSNLPEFAEAFDCKPGTPYHPDNVCEVW